MAVSQATVITLYLLSSSNLKLRPILTRQMKPGHPTMIKFNSRIDLDRFSQIGLSVSDTDMPGRVLQSGNPDAAQPAAQRA